MIAGLAELRSLGWACSPNGYWARFSAGIVLIRRVLLVQLKKEAERRARLAR
jgi:hypothetical protein